MSFRKESSVRKRRLGLDLLESRLALDSTLVFSEVMYNPAGETDDTLEWIEFYNQLGVQLDISEWKLSGGADFTFPAGTVVPARGYLVVARSPVDLQAASGFAGALGPFVGQLNNDGETLSLENNDGRLMNEISYGDNGAWPVGPDGGGVTLAKRDRNSASEPAANWTSSIRMGGTPGAANAIPTLLARPAFNEAAPVTEPDYWLEISNDGPASANLNGYVLSVTGTPGGEYVFGAQTIPAGGMTTVSEATLGFRPADGEKIFLYSAGKQQLIDARVATLQLRGRSDARGGQWLYPNAATPGAANTFAFHDEIVINEIMYHAPPEPRRPAVIDTQTLLPFGATWRYNDTDLAAPSNWATVVHPVSNPTWKSGSAAIGYDTATVPVAIATTVAAPQTVTPRIMTYYFETEFDFAGDPAGAALQLRHEIDDGAVFYLNGVEVYRYNMSTGAVNSETPASTAVSDATINGPFSIPAAALVSGSNRLSVEVHQNGTGSTDIVFAAELSVTTATTPATPYLEDPEEWIELYNRGATDVDLGGWKLEDGIEYTFPAGTTIPAGGYLVVAKDAAVLAAKYPSLAIVGDYSGTLGNAEDVIRLVDADNNPADEVHYLQDKPWYAYADGGGSSLELRNPAADNSKSGAWGASIESGESSWQTYTLRKTSSEPLNLGGAQFNEFIFGLLSDGEFLLDDVSVIADPDGAATQMIQNGGFQADTVGQPAATWRLIGTHRGRVVVDPADAANKALHVVAVGAQQHVHDHAETTFVGNTAIVDGRTYEISFKAKWLAGSRQVNHRLYFSRASYTTILDAPQTFGTPGAVNSIYVENHGPTYEKLGHSPIVPSPSQAVTVTVRAADPDGVAGLTLRYNVNGGAWNNVTMTAGAGGLYTGTIPGQSSGVVQFYVEGRDSLNVTSFFPADGPNSRALYQVVTPPGAVSIETLRLVLLPADNSRLFSGTERMSNARVGATLVRGTEEVFYDVGVRQTGSRWVRPNSGYRVDLRPDHRYLGVHDSIRLDLAGPKEILFKQMVNRAGGSEVSMYDDIIRFISPQHGTRTILLNLARYEDIYLDEQFENGSDGTLFELDDITFPTGPNPAPEGLKSGTEVSPQDMFYRGADPESYRGQMIIKSNRNKDDFDPIVSFTRALQNVDGLPTAQWNAQMNEVMDVDLWMRHYATQAFLGNWDTWGFGRPKNLRLYIRPDDGKVIPLYWDADLANLTEPLIYNDGGGGVSRLDEVRNVPANLRLFWGHMLDLVDRSFNATYAGPWASYYGTLGAGTGAGDTSAIGSRETLARNQAAAAIGQVAFNITTNGGNPLTVANVAATIAGDGWINVRTIRLAGESEPLAVTWTDQNSWRATVPVRYGTHDLTFEAFDFRGNPIGQDTITVTSTVSDRPLEDFLRITELMYHPDDPSPAERTAGFADADLFEFIELQNISATETLDLSGVRLADGVMFDFTGSDVTSLAPGQFVVVLADRDAFAARYSSAGISIAGEYEGQLNNAGETVRLEDPNTLTIQSFTYDDTGPTWHPTTDGEGPSLVIIDPLADVAMWDQGVSWRPSSVMGGTPGSTESPLMPGDVNGDARVDLLDLAALQLHIGMANGATRSDGDLDGDHDVDRDDVGILLANYAQAPVAPTPSPAAAAAPSAVVSGAGSLNRFRATRGERLTARAVDRVLETRLPATVGVSGPATLRASRRAASARQIATFDQLFSQNN
jgi:hypothetical protein